MPAIITLNSRHTIFHIPKHIRINGYNLAAISLVFQSIQKNLRNGIVSYLQVLFQFLGTKSPFAPIREACR